MNNSRRRFLKTGSIVALAASIPAQLDQVLGQGRRPITQAPGVNGVIPLQSQRDPLLYLRRSYFQPYVNSRFEVLTAMGTRVVPLTLATVDGPRVRPGCKGPVKPRASKSAKARVTTEQAGELDSFSLLFRGSGKAPLKQDVYDIQHRALGKFRLLLVPVVSKDGKALYYEVVFNRSRPQ